MSDIQSLWIQETYRKKEKMMLLCFIILIFNLNFNLSVGVTFTVYSRTTSVSVSVGEDAIVNCYLKPELNAENMEIKWLRSEDASLVHQYRNGRDETVDTYFSGRTELIKDDIKKGNISLRIKNIKILDEGSYTCYFQNEYMFDEATTEILPMAFDTGLDFQIEYYSEDHIKVSCFSSHWYPKPETNWIDDNGQILKEHSISVTLNEVNTYNVNTSIVCKNSKKISCLIQNVQPGVPRVASIHIADSVFPGNLGLNVSITFNVLLAILLAILVFRTFVQYKKKRNQKEFKEALKNTVDVNLDPDTAHPELELSEDLKCLSRSCRKDVEMNDRRFDTRLYVLGKDHLKKDKNYWEVNVHSAAHWTIGIADDHMNRKGKITLSPNEGTWAIERITTEYRALVNNTKNTKIKISGTLQTVGIYLNLENSELIFYNNDDGQILYRYKDRSLKKKPLLPFFSTWTLGERIHICFKDCKYCVNNVNNETTNLLAPSINQNNSDQV